MAAPGAAGAAQPVSMLDGYNFNGAKAYKDSKLCNLLFTAEASRRLAKKNAKATAHAFSPGLIPSPDGFFRYQPKIFAKTFNAIATKAGVAETSEFGGACLSYVATAPLLDSSTNGWWDTDPDRGGSSRVRYAIDRSSDRRRQFSISDDGPVTSQRALDGEQCERGGHLTGRRDICVSFGDWVDVRRGSRAAAGPPTRSRATRPP